MKETNEDFWFLVKDGRFGDASGPSFVPLSPVFPDEFALDHYLFRFVRDAEGRAMSVVGPYDGMVWVMGSRMDEAAGPGKQEWKKNGWLHFEGSEQDFLLTEHIPTVDLADASFKKPILVRTEFKVSGMVRAQFIDVRLTDVKLTMCDLRKTVLTRCIFTGVDFKYSDLRGLPLEGQTFVGVKFGEAAMNEVTFRGATLKNVSFTPPFSLTKKYYNAIKTIRFEGATMDKLTFAGLKGMEVDLPKVTVV